MRRLIGVNSAAGNYFRSGIPKASDRGAHLKGEVRDDTIKRLFCKL